NVLTVNKLFAWAIATGEVSTPIPVSLTTMAIDAENPGLLKQFTDTDLFFLNASFNQATVGFESNLSPYVENTPIQSLGVGAWGTLPWGSFTWGGVDGGETAIPTLVPRNKSHAHWIKLSVSLEECFKNFQM